MQSNQAYVFFKKPTSEPSLIRSSGFTAPVFCGFFPPRLGPTFVHPPGYVTPALLGEEASRGSQRQPDRQQAGKETRHLPKREVTCTSTSDKEEGRRRSLIRNGNVGFHWQIPMAGLMWWWCPTYGMTIPGNMALSWILQMLALP